MYTRHTHIQRNPSKLHPANENFPIQCHNISFSMVFIVKTYNCIKSKPLAIEQPIFGVDEMVAISAAPGSNPGYYKDVETYRVCEYLKKKNLK